jgi:hypothetical protein
MARFYSKKISECLEGINDKLLIPDLIVVKEGISCGDKLILSGQLERDVLNFHFNSEEACMLCRASCQFFEDKFQNISFSTLKEKIALLIDAYEKNKSELFRLFELQYEKYSLRYECLISPLKLLQSFIDELLSTKYEYGEKPETLSMLECDACVSACRINWGNKHTKKIDHHGNRNYETHYLENWLPLGKIEITSDEIELLKKMCSNMTPYDHQFLSDHTMNSVVLHHLYKYAPELIDDAWKPAAYLIQKNEITVPKVEEIKEYIKEQNLAVYFVKGYISQKYYENPSLRIHSDYDIISENSDDAFHLANWLLQKGFTIRPNLFSYKQMNYDGKQIISGHFHLQKIIDDEFMFELDITFPGFPINRVDLFFPKYYNYRISTEDQIVITLLHLFKHSNIYMKDINDLHYMLQDKSIDLDYLALELDRYSLWDFFKLAVSYISVSFPNGKEKMSFVMEKFKIDDSIAKSYRNWPYDKSSHYRIKANDLNYRLAYSVDFERQFLFPIAIFKEQINLSQFRSVFDSLAYEYEVVLDTIYKFTNGAYVFYCTPIGIFINNYIDTTSVERNEFIRIIRKFIDDIGNVKLLPIPYATQHFYVRSI